RAAADEAAPEEGPAVEDAPEALAPSHPDRSEDDEPTPPPLALVPEPEPEPEPRIEPEQAPQPVADASDDEPVDEHAPIPVAALLADHDMVDPPEQWESLDEPVPISHFERFRRDRADHGVESAEHAKIAVYAGLVVFSRVARRLLLARDRPRGGAIARHPAHPPADPRRRCRRHRRAVAGLARDRPRRGRHRGRDGDRPPP